MPRRLLNRLRSGASLWPSLLMLLAALGSLALADWQALRRLESVSEMTEQRARARNGRLFLAQTLSLHKDLETGVRGFVITGREDFLIPYIQALADMPALQLQLRASLSLPLPAGQDWDELEQLSAQRQRLLADTVALRRSRGLHVLEEQQLFEQGRRAMDALRERFARLDAHQLARIEALHAQVQALRAEAQRASALATSLSLLLAGAALALLWRERQRRQRAQAALQQANVELDARVVARTAELDAARTQITAFAAQQDRAIEAERRRLAREVHDQIGQVFTAIKLIVSGLPATALPPRQAQALDQALQQGVTTSRRITAELRPPLLDELGLAAALRHHLQQVIEPVGLATQLAVQDAARLTSEQALSLFRIAQEALTNVLRHASARQVQIEGGLSADGRHYRLRVQDDGVGLGAGTARPGALGLTGMRERAAWHGGTLQLGPGAQGGTLITVTLPLQTPDEVPAD
ncbi:CHASE3 domain-containing protein [Inhella sp.]|uniref:CHASE3 domain-containing protein n=1 Tax=Inhella sp. TaxID=1921806 RepID=UPI0035B19CC6